jgi:hypothetical protein
LAVALYRETAIPLTEIARMAEVLEPTAGRWVEKVDAPHRRLGRGVVPKDEMAILRASNKSLEDALEKAWARLAELDRDPAACDELIKSCRLEMATRIHHPLTRLSEITQVVKTLHEIMDREKGIAPDTRPEWMDELQGTLLAYQAVARPAPETLTDHDRGLIIDDIRGNLHDAK